MCLSIFSVTHWNTTDSVNISQITSTYLQSFKAIEEREIKRERENERERERTGTVCLPSPYVGSAYLTTYLPTFTYGIHSRFYPTRTPLSLSLSLFFLSLTLSLAFSRSLYPHKNPVSLFCSFSLSWLYNF